MKARAIVDRLREPSTWAGLSALALLFGRADAAAALTMLGQSLPDVVAAGAAVAAVVMRDKAAEP